LQVSAQRFRQANNIGALIAGKANPFAAEVGSFRAQLSVIDPKRVLATDAEMTAFWSQTAVGSEPVNLTNDGVSASALDEPVR
jgi:hypothetical protein